MSNFKKIKMKSPDPFLGKIVADNTLARIAHINQLIDQLNEIPISGPVGPQGPIGPTGAQGVQGPVGPQGAIGPVGPAGLNWQGAWSASGTYVVDDAVGYNGASWFCIGNVGPSATPPDVDTANWALLAAEGAQGPIGPAGAQGPTGPQGPAATPAYKVYMAKITQFGTNPPIEEAVIENTFINPVTFSYNGIGQYTIDCLDIANNGDKIAIYFQQGSGSLGMTYTLSAVTNSISMVAWNNLSSNFQNNAFSKAFVEIRIYP
jgi:hypothetical protein